MSKHGPQSPNEMIVDVWSDVVCPWCFIGKRRLEKGVAEIKAANPTVEVKIRHRAFQLQPDIEGVVPTKDHLALIQNALQRCRRMSVQLLMVKAFAMT